MMNWYENPELHDEDYEELMALLNEEPAETEGEALGEVEEFMAVWGLAVL